MRTLIICAITATVLSASAVTALLLKKGSKTPPARSAPSEAPSGGDRLSPVITQGIRDHAREYEGLYESVYLAANADECDAEAYTEWCERTVAHGGGAFRQAFVSEFSAQDADDEVLLRQKLNKLLAYITEAGIRRDANSGDAIVYSQADDKKYIGAAGESLIGKTCRVIKPAWTMQDVVIEPGLVMPEV